MGGDVNTHIRTHKRQERKDMSRDTKKRHMEGDIIGEMTGAALLERGSPCQSKYNP